MPASTARRPVRPDARPLPEVPDGAGDVRTADLRAGTVLALVGGALLMVLGLHGTLSAQGLGEAAARERQRRTAEPKAPAQVFTDADLPSGDESAEDAEAEAREDDGPPELSEVGAADPLREELDREREERALAEREWRARFAEARARVREAEARCWQEVVRTRFHEGIPVQMKVQEFVETEEFRRAKQELADLEEEFRRTGLPPGWARE